jgi:hypothetical protein
MSLGKEKKARPVATKRPMHLIFRSSRAVGKFWDALAYSRIVEWGRDWQGMLAYVSTNVLEARGFPRDRVDAWFGLRAEVLRGDKPLG